MKRVRVSTTVDEPLLASARKLLRGVPDSRLIDRALQALIDSVEAAAEIRGLERFPYEDDPGLSFTGVGEPPLPYDDEVPKEVLAMARARRRRRT
jgi:hypothetical protein